MLKRVLKAILTGAACAVGFVMTAALALSITGRDTAYQRTILQVGIPAVSNELGITASTTQTLVGAYQLSAGFSQITTANASDAVKLPNMSSLGPPTNIDGSLNVVIANNTANSVQVFPNLSTDVIVSNGSAGGAGAAFTLTTLKTLECWAATASGRWYCTMG
jgi:hypothetical protein